MRYGSTIFELVIVKMGYSQIAPLRRVPNVDTRQAGAVIDRVLIRATGDPFIGGRLELTGRVVTAMANHAPRAYLLRVSNSLANMAVGLLRQYSRTLSVMAAFLSRSSVVRFALPLM